ncbi:MAG: MarR family transcriptional regulator [Alphaproteobacteria bacterium]|nr:MarR family transcriptional regulator [Alphaproteobacteria bacterium]
MVDLNSNIDTIPLREEDLRQGIELLFYAYRDFTSEPDTILNKYDLGRAHHRVIYFVGRNPGITVTELLEILRITKQSLSRVLSHLLETNFINQRADLADRRRKQLTLSDKGKVLEHELTSTQMDRFARAYREAGAEAVEGFRRVLIGIVEPEDRANVRPAAIRAQNRR